MLWKLRCSIIKKNKKKKNKIKNTVIDKKLTKYQEHLFQQEDIKILNFYLHSDIALIAPIEMQ